MRHVSHEDALPSGNLLIPQQVSWFLSRALRSRGSGPHPEGCTHSGEKIPVCCCIAFKGKKNLHSMWMIKNRFHVYNSYNSNLITTMYGVCIFVFSSFHSQHSDILHPSVHYLELRIVCSMRLIMESVASLHLSYWFCTVCKSSSLCFITTKHFLYFSL